MKRLIKGGRVIDPASGTEKNLDLLLEDGVIVKVGERLAAKEAPQEAPQEAEVLDATGLVIIPGLIDMHCHLREPGQEYKESIASGCAAAVKGGFTTLLAMANTSPVNDRAPVTEYILEKARAAGLARVLPVGAVTQGQKGEALAELGELAQAGCVALSDDGHPVTNGLLLRRAMEYASVFGLLVLDHAEDPTLAGEGVMAEGAVATRLGLEGIPSSAFDAAIARDIAVVRDTRRPLHIQHVSTAAGVDLIRRAKAEGLPVTAESCPHYFTLTDSAVAGYATAAKVKPPLGSEEDREAVIAGLVDGTLEVLATDHAPHHRDEKEVEFDRAAYGISGLETALSLTLLLSQERGIPLPALLKKWTADPARILGLPSGRIVEGAPADLALVDLAATWTVEPEKLVSKGKNTPFAGRTLPGVVRATIVAGLTVYGG